MSKVRATYCLLLLAILSACSSGGGNVTPARNATTQDAAVAAAATSTTSVRPGAIPALPPNVSIDSLYATQVSQFSKYDSFGPATPPPAVALVAGRQAEVRVFAINTSGKPQPTGNPGMRISVNGANLSDVPEPAGLKANFPTTFTAADELQPGLSYNEAIPASMMVAPNVTLTATVLGPDGKPTNQTQTISVPVMNTGSKIVHLVPLKIAGNTGLTASIDTGHVATFLPFSGISYITEPTLTIPPGKDGNTNDKTILNALDAKYSGTTDIYYGVVPGTMDNPPTINIDCGAAYQVPPYVAFGPDSNEFSDVCDRVGLGDAGHVPPHEIAHAYGVNHAPCSVPGSPATKPDPWWAAHGSSDAHIISDGWNFEDSTVVNGATTKDLMSYCSPYWIGAYDWGKLVADVGATTTTAAPSSSMPSLDGQLYYAVGVTILQSGALSIDWPYTYFGKQNFKPQQGPVTFVGLDAGGHILFSQSAPIDTIGDFSPHPQQVANVDIPISLSIEQQLSTIRVSYNGRTESLEGLPSGPIVAKVVALDATHVSVTFDCSHFRELFVWQPQGRSSAYCSSPIVETSDSDVYIDFTNGIKTVAHAVKVHVQGR